MKGNGYGISQIYPVKTSFEIPFICMKEEFILNIEYMHRLYLELASLEDQGITIWLEGCPSNSEHVASQINIHDENLYMRDYIFEGGSLKEVHFNKVKK